MGQHHRLADGGDVVEPGIAPDPAGEPEGLADEGGDGNEQRQAAPQRQRRPGQDVVAHPEIERDEIGEPAKRRVEERDHERAAHRPAAGGHGSRL